MLFTEEAAKVSGIPYVMDAFKEEAEMVLKGSYPTGNGQKKKEKAPTSV